MARRLNVLAEDPLLRPLWAAVHERLSRGGATERSTVAVRGASPDTRRAVDRLLGRVSSTTELRVQLGTLQSALAVAGTETAAVVTAAIGPIVNRRAVRAATALDREATWKTVLEHPTAAEPEIADWLQRLQAQGRLDRAGGGTALMAALDVLGVLPLATEPIGRPVLAAAVLGREHGLDDNTAIGRLVTAGLAARLGAPTPTTSAGRAALWAGAGVTLDSVSTPVLTLGLRPRPTGPLTEAALRWADSGVPLPLPGRAVAAERWRVSPGQVVSVCENPSVLEAAASKLGSSAPPLICVSGMPGRAAGALLTELAAGGARLRYHGDFGAGGITIANVVIARCDAEPWLMATLDHRGAVERLERENRRPEPLRGRVPEASWDADLAGSITSYGFEVTEEHVLDALLDDLAADVQER